MFDPIGDREESMQFGYAIINRQAIKYMQQRIKLRLPHMKPFQLAILMHPQW